MIRPISETQTTAIFTGPREIPKHITGSVEAKISSATPLVNPGRFNEFMLRLASASPEHHSVEGNYQSMLMLGSCSIEMAWQLAGDLHIPRPRRLHEHNQSVLNTYNRVFAGNFTDPRDRVLRPMFALQDIGKAHCVALADPNDKRRGRNQAIHNDRITHNVLMAVSAAVLSLEEEAVIRLLGRQSSIGQALYQHSEKGSSLGEAVAPAQQELGKLRGLCPPDYRDRFDDYLIVSYLADAGAHTQKARFKDATTGEIMPDVTEEDRFTADGQETGLSLDRLFSPDHPDDLRLFQPKHLAVMEQLFPRHYR